MQARSPFGALALLLLCALPLAACEESKGHRGDAGEEDDEDASSEDASSVRDGGGGAAESGTDSAVANDDAGSSDTGAGDAASGDDASVTDGGSDSGPTDPLAPFALDCARLPSGGVCQGGPREVLLVTEETGLIAMFDPADGHFLGYFKRPAANYWVDGDEGYNFATQGPDQCIWSASEEAGIERWNTDGTFRDVPLQPHFLPVSEGPDQPAMQSPVTFSFTANKLYVSSSPSYRNDRVLAWNLDGSFDKIAYADELTIQSLLVLGDGSLLIADDARNRVIRVPSAGGAPIPVLGGLDWPAQISYAGGKKLLVSDVTLSTPAYEVDIDTMMAREINPFRDPEKDESSSNKYGIAQLKNGKWLITGGQFLVSTLDPASTNPSGQNAKVWEDDAVDTLNFKHVGRACLPAAFVESRASKPANDTCIAPPTGPNLFAEDFEGAGDFTGSGTERHYNSLYDRAASGVTTSVGAGPAAGMAANNTRTLRIEGAGTLAGGEARKTGLVANFTGGQPTYVSYRMYVGAAVQQQWLGFLTLENAAANSSEYDYLAATFVYNGYFRGGNSNAASEDPDQIGKWLRVELRNINWTTRTFDLYLDCKRIAEAIALPAGYGDSIDRIDLFNYAETPNANTVAWFDDILIK